MPLIDSFGYPLSLSDEAALGHWTETVRAFLAHSSKTPVHLARTVELAPDFALAHAAHGLFCMLLGRRELVCTAEDDWCRASAGQQRVGATERERAVIDALRDWLDGRPSRAASRLDLMLASYPRDALLMKLVHAIRFVLGDSVGMRRSLATVSGAYDSGHPAYGYMLGCQSFALEETGDYAEAEKLGRDALQHAPDDAWGLHAVAHVLDMNGRSGEGRIWLETNTAAFAHCNNFRFHVWWHLALMYLDQGNVDRVLALYDQEIRAERTDDYRDISNAASLLVRLEIEGVHVGGRWEELASLSEARVNDHCNVFADLHYMLSLVGADRRRAADQMLASMSAHAEEPTDMGRIAGAAGVQVALGLESYRLGNFFSAYRHFTEGRRNLRDIGGSHAQRDVFERIAIDATMRAGMPEEAEQLLRERVALRGATDRFSAERLEQVTRMARRTALMQNPRLRAEPQRAVWGN
ncbi:MAG: tetratricopeptide repeat protein [Pannonibacter sp.]